METDLRRHKRKYLTPKRNIQNSKSYTNHEKGDEWNNKDCGTQTSTTLFRKTESSETDTSSSSFGAKETELRTTNYMTFTDMENLKVTTNLINYVEHKSRPEVKHKSDDQLIKMYLSRSQKNLNGSDDRLSRSSFLLQRSPFAQLFKSASSTMKSNSCAESGYFFPRKKFQNQSVTNSENDCQFCEYDGSSQCGKGDCVAANASKQIANEEKNLSNNPIDSEEDSLDQYEQMELPKIEPKKVETFASPSASPRVTDSEQQRRERRKKNVLCYRANFCKLRSRSFLQPTIASFQKDLLNKVKSLDNIITSPRANVPSATTNNVHYRLLFTDHPSESDPSYYNKRRLSKSPPRTNLIVPKVFRSPTNLKQKLLAPEESLILNIINKVKNPDWSVALRGLAELLQFCKTNLLTAYDHLPTAYQRLIQLIRCSRSYANKNACQLCGSFFEVVKDTRRPEFDEVVDALLAKTADHTHIVRHEANVALDCMVTNVPFFHALRVLTNRAPEHKNPLVRFATVRLIICAIVLQNPSVLFNSSSMENQRKKVLEMMMKFVLDKNKDVKKYGARLYNILHNEPGFSDSLKKYFDRIQLMDLRKALQAISCCIK